MECSPLALSSSGQPASRSVPPASGILPDTGVRVRPRVLIIDHHDAAREMYAWCLRAAGWVVREVSVGADAIIEAAVFQPSVIVVDMQLPDVAGSEVARQLKNDERTRDIPVVAYSASDGELDARAARVAGCAEFFPKNRAPEALRALLDGLLG